MDLLGSPAPLALAAELLRQEPQLLLLAEAALAAGDVTGAQDTVDAAFVHVAGTGERYYEAEPCRLRAECAPRALDRQAHLPTAP